MTRSRPKPSSEVDHDRLKRDLGLGGAIVTGFGSIVGTGDFVAIGLASGRWGDIRRAGHSPRRGGDGVQRAVVGLPRRPVSGGGWNLRIRTSGAELVLGFTAGWLFLLAKTASAATAALGVGLYGMTNLAVLAVDRTRPTSWLGLASCVFLSFFVSPGVWATGASLAAVGLVWKIGYT